MTKAKELEQAVIEAQQPKVEDLKEMEIELKQEEQKNIIKFPGIILDLSNDWQLNQFKNSYCKGANPQELGMFIATIKTTGLNPFKKEIWFVKYWSSPAQIFVGRDWYRKVAKQHTDYNWHRTDCVCENDTFKVKNWQIEEHSYTLKDRWKVVGAYCIAKIQGQGEPLMHFVDFAEYNTGKSKWNSSPKTMIKKVAEAQCLRMAFDDLLEWTYDESEVYDTNILESKEEVIEEKGDKLKDKYAKLKPNQEKTNENT